MDYYTTSFDNAALQGGGAAIINLGSRVKKGSLAAKRQMAWLRSLKGTKKGSGYYYGEDAKKRQRLAGKMMLHDNHLWLKQRPIYGGISPFTFVGPYFKTLFNWGKSWHDENKEQKAELERLRKLKASKGGKFELKDIGDFFAGPLGWIRMGIRKKRAREIEKLKNELGEH